MLTRELATLWLTVAIPTELEALHHADMHQERVKMFAEAAEVFSQERERLPKVRRT
jgi:hypothetical protein